MSDWLTPKQIADLGCPELPASVRGINRWAEKQGWRRAEGKARLSRTAGRPVWEYHTSLLPTSAQSKKVVKLDIAPKPKAAEIADAWARFETLSNDQKRGCEERLSVLVQVDQMIAGGASVTQAVTLVASRNGLGERSIYNWRKAVEGQDRADWLALLAPAPRKRRDRAEIHPDAWSAIVSDYLRPSAPKLTVCIRRAAREAKKQGWGGFPHERSLRRRLDAEVPAAIRKIAREGRVAARILFPAQRRSVAGLHAMQAVNMDGHKFDVFTRWPDGRIVRPTMVALQDLYSRKIVAWRLSDSENKETVRLAIGDLVSRWGIPDALTTDNSRAFASKWISGGAKTRFRFKIRDEEPLGLLPSLGVELHFAIPARGQSKPIERAFRDLSESIAKHPVCEGAYTGSSVDAKPENHGNAAVPIDTFRQLVAAEVAAHNAQSGRRSEMAKGRSFDETFEESYADAIVRWPSEAQKALWLLAAEQMRTQKGSGEIHMLGNRYWAPALNAHQNERVVVRFDPDNLHEAVRVYDASDRFICAADCVSDVGFYDIRAAREQARNETAYLKALKDEQAALAALSPDQLGDLYGGGKVPDEATPPQPKIKRLAVAGGRPRSQQVPQPVDAPDTQEFEDAFANGLRLIAGGREGG